MRLFFFIFLSCSFVNSQEILNVKPVLSKLSDTTSLALVVTGAMSTLATQPYDDQIRADWKDYRQMSQSTASLGNFLGSGIVGVVLAGGQYLFDPYEENWKSHARALIWQTATVFTMKYSFGKQRPGNRSSYHSFPSGHTATAFATATSLTYSYGWKAAIISYPLAAFVGASRWADDMHWGSDVVAGAFVGIIIARACNSVDEASKSQGNPAHLTPIISPDFGGLNYSYSF